ncbi:hypothetical protein OC835_005189 [Tilletia horrida]|nr:hypothetical protein OC835_005189 [Tilletia horrida]
MSRDDGPAASSSSQPSRAQLTSSPSPATATASAPASTSATSSFILNSDMKPLEDLLPLDRVDKFLTGPGGPLEVTYEIIDGRVQATFASQKIIMRDYVLNSFKTFSRRTHLVYGDVRLTYAESQAQAFQLANALRVDYGVRKGDRIAIISRNTTHFALTVLATYLIGGIVVPINAFAEAATLAFCIQDADARVVVCDVERWHRLYDPTVGGGIAGVAAKSRALQAIIVSPWKYDTYVPRAERDWLRQDVLASIKDASAAHKIPSIAIADWDDVFARSTSYPNLPLYPVSAEDPAMIMYTSGTTGLPKGVLSNQRQILGALGVGGVHAARAFIRRGQAPPTPAGPEVHDEADCPSTLALSPFFHVTGLQSGLMSSTIRGGRVVFLPSYSAERAIQIIRKERIKLVSGVGFMMREVMKLAKPGDLDSIEALAHGGSSSANELPGETQQSKPRVAASVGYGLTETNGLVMGAYLDEYIALPDSIGAPVPGVDVLIVDPETLRVLPDGQPGELLIRSPCNATGYWRRPKETAETFLKDGFLRTGDLARRDPNGYVFILDRIKDLIIRGGENVSCTSVEGAVHGDPRVRECAAVGVPDERLGERVGIIVVIEPSSSLDAQGVQDIARAKGLPKFAIPEVVWVRTEPLEKNANGKVVKRNLKEELKRWMKGEGRVSKL